MMHNLPHPGEVIRELCIKPLGLTVTDAAKALGISRKALSELLNGHTGISPEMAVRLSIALIPHLRVGLHSRCNMTCGK